MTSQVFYCDRTKAPATERSRIGLFEYAVALDLGQQWADADGSDVHITRSNGSGQIEQRVLTLRPRAAGEPNATGE